MTALIDKLHEAHDEIEAMTRGVIASIRDDDRDVMHDDFAVLERRLLDHMSWEEMYLLPAYEKDYPESATKIRAQHADFRRRLGEIGLAIDLHSVRAEHFEELAARLGAHAEAEEVMYSTIAGRLPEEQEEAISGRYDRFLSLLKHVPMIGG